MADDCSESRRRHHQVLVPGRSPRLFRSRSGTSSSSATSLTENQTPNNKIVSTREVAVTKRSNSATKSRTIKGGENLSPYVLSSTSSRGKHQQKSSVQSKDDNLKLLQRTQNKIDVPTRKTRSACTSPSAWALSSGRSSCSSSSRASSSPGRNMPPFSPLPVPKSPCSATGKRMTKSSSSSSSSSISVNGFWSFLKKKKVSPEQQEEHHQSRLLHTRLLQWRFANARAEASMNLTKRLAQKKLFDVWVINSMLRSHALEKRIQVQKLKQEIKVSQLLNSQFSLLKEWGRMEGKNTEAVGRVARKLSAIATCIPLVNSAKAEVRSMHEAMSTAIEVLEAISAAIRTMQSQVETTCYMLTETIILLKEQKEYVIELEKRLTECSSLEATEESLRAHCIQLVREFKRVEECMLEG